MLSTNRFSSNRVGAAALAFASASIAAVTTILQLTAGAGRPESFGGTAAPAPMQWPGAMLALASASGLLALAWLRGRQTPPSGGPSAPVQRYAMRTLLLTLTASAALPLALLLGYHMQREARLEIEKARQLVTGLADITVADATAVIAESERVARYLAERPLVRSLDPRRCDPYLHELVRLNNQYANLAIVDLGGNTVCSALRMPAGNRTGSGNTAWLQALKSDRAISISGPQRGAFADRWTIVIAQPIRGDDGAVVGAAAVVVDLEAFQPAVKAALPAGGVAGIMDGKGVVVARFGPTPVEAGRDVSDTAIGRTILARQQNSEILVGNDGVERYYAYRKIERSGWYAVVGVPTQLVYGEARRNAGVNLMVGVAVALFAGLLAFAIHRRIVVPLAALRDTARTIAAGDRTCRAPEGGPAEIAEVATTFNRMMDLIPRIEGELQVSEDHYRMLFEASPDAIRVVCDNRIVMLNQAALALHRVPRKEDLLGRNVVDTMHPDFHERVRARIRAVLEERRVLPGDEQILVRDDGTECWIESIVLPFTYQGKAALLSIVRDLSERKGAEVRVRRLIDMRLTVGKVHEAIARERDWRALCESAARIVVEHGRLTSALIRMHDPATGNLIPWAGHGHRTGRLGHEVISASDPEAPPARAFSTRQRVIINRMESAAIDLSARNDALAQGVGSAGLFPMLWEGRAIGTLAVFAGNPDVFDDEFAGLLDEIASNLAFANAKYKTDEALAETNERLTGMIRSAMDAIITVDGDMRITVFNRAAESMFGIESAAAIGMPLETLLPQRYRDSHAGWMRSFAAGGMTTRSMGNPGKVIARRTNGDEFPVEASISHARTGGEVMYTVIMRDVTGRLATERSLAEAERRYRSLVENSPGGVALVEADRIEYANPGLVRMLGHEKSTDLVGTAVYAVLTPPFHAVVRHNLRMLSQSPGRSLPQGRVRMQRRDGSVIDVETAASAIDIAGRILIQVEMRDVTRELHAMAEIQALNRSLESRIAGRTNELTRANRDLEAFSYSIAHDLRAPLRSMSGFAQFLAMDVREGDYTGLQQHVSRIVTNAEKMNALIDGLLNVARASHVPLAQDRVDFVALVADVLDETGARRGARVDVDALPAVLGDAVTLRQVWVNLVTNALKYSAGRPAPAITIRHQIGEREVTFSVNDNGAGFDPAYAGKLFGVFQRLHGSSEFEGNGIGLAIVKRIVERHDGRVWAEGRPGAGATFHFSLPVTRLAAD